MSAATVVITNPGAGSDSSGAQRIRERLVGRVACDVVEAAGWEAARQAARDAVRQGAQRVIAAGGDGTINAVINGIGSDLARVVFGVLPSGTGNDFARALLGTKDLEAGIEALAAGRTRPMDVGRIRRYAAVSGAAAAAGSEPEPLFFVNVIAAGFSAIATEEVDEGLKDLVGTLAFGVSAAKSLSQAQEYQAQIEFDDEASIDLSLYNIVIANGQFIGGGVPIAPHAQLDDGQFDVLILPAVGAAQLLALLPQILRGQHVSNEQIVVRRARQLRIRSKPALPLSVDGEAIGEWDAAYEVLPGALRVIAP
jgi:diacylglycerol kinase (ATP)